MTTPRHSSLLRGNQDVDRLRSFSDCVFAVAITLVAVSFVVPNREPSDVRLEDFLSREWPRFASFIVGFAVIGLYWLSHHRTFQIVVRVDGRVQAINLALLFFVVLSPFTTELLATYRTFGSAYLAFSANAAAIGVCNWVLLGDAVRRGLVPATLDRRAVRLYLWRAGLLPVVFAMAALGALVSVPLAIAGWLLLPAGRAVLRTVLGPMPEVEERVEASERDVPAQLQAEDHTPVTSRQRGNLARLLSFSDNVYAFAITLLVVQLKLPRAESPSDEALRAFLGSLVSPAMAAYTIGFVVIGLFWALHCRYFAVVDRSDTGLLVRNLVHLMTVAVLPFATELLSRFEAFGVPLVVYSVVNALVGATLASCLWHAASGHRLVDAAWSDATLRAWRRLSLVVPIGFAVAAAVGPFAPWAVWVLWVLPWVVLRPVEERALGAV